VNLLLTCSVMPDLDRDDLEIWKHFCLFDWMPGREILPYLRFAPASASALIDAIVFVEPNLIRWIHGLAGRAPLAYSLAR
jgi:hypothetical protein